MATVRDQEINVVASVSGRLMDHKQCIDQKREPYSLLLNINGNRCWMVTTDCQAVYKRLQRKSLKVPVWISLSGLSRQENSSSLSGSQPLGKEPFASKFGAQQEWRRLINVEVDNWSATELKASAMSLRKRNQSQRCCF